MKDETQEKPSLPKSSQESNEDQEMIDQEETSTIEQAIDLVNQKEFDILQMIRF